MLALLLLLLLLPLLWSGSLQEEQGYTLQVPDSVTVQAGLCVLVSCSFSYPWEYWYSSGELFIYWFREGDYSRYRELVATNNPGRGVTHKRFQPVGHIWAGNCSLNIKDARKEDTGTYSFRVERGPHVQYTYREKKLNLQVTDMTEKPVIHFSEPLESGRPTRLSCRLPGSCRGRSITFSWMGDVLNSMDPKTLQSSELTFTPRPQDHSTNLTCRVKLQGDRISTQSTVLLNVSYAPQNFSITVFSNAAASKILPNASSFDVLEGQSLRLHCAVSSNPPARLSWSWGSPTLNAPHVSDTGVLELPSMGPAEEGGFTCYAKNSLGSQTASVSLALLYPPKMLGSTCSWGAKGLHCTCSSWAQPAPFLSWQIGEGRLEGNSSNASFTVTSSSAGPWANSSLSLREEISAGLRLRCEAKNVHGSRSIVVMVLPGKSASGLPQALAGLGGAGTMALLSLCLCLAFFCIVKVRRQKAAGRPEAMDDEDPVMDTVTWGSRQTPWPGSSQDQSYPAGDAPPLRLPKELHYASLSFQEMTSQKPQDREAPSSTEYSEIKISK